MIDSISPLISVVIPTYNRAELIGKAIQSILDQSYKDWELIIVDNYSDDNTKEIIRAFNDDRIILLSTPRTGSVAVSRNLGVSHSSGEWIAFLDSDDWWFPRKLEFVSEIIQQGPDLIYHDLQIVSLDGLPIKRRRTKSRRLKSPIYFDLLLEGNDIPLSSVVLRKSVFTFVNGMNESPNFLAIEDYDAWLRIAQVTEKFIHVPKILGAYRLHEGNIGHLNNFQYLSSALSAHLNKLDSSQLRRYQSLYTYQIARDLYKKKFFRESTVPLIFSLKYARISLSFKALIMLIMNFFFRGIVPKN